MTDDDTPIVGVDLRGVLQDLAGRLERLEQRNARTDNVLLDMNAVDEKRIDINCAVDALDGEVEALLERAFARVADAVRRKLEGA